MARWVWLGGLGVVLLAGSTPSQGTRLGCGARSLAGGTQEAADPFFSLVKIINKQNLLRRYHGMKRKHPVAVWAQD